MNEQQNTRRKFILKSAGVAATAAIAGWFGFSKYQDNNKETETVKMLTQEGKLVEVNKKLLASFGKKIKDEELKQWIKK